MKQIDKIKNRIISGNKIYNYSAIARFIGMDVSNFTKAIKGELAANGEPFELSEDRQKKVIEYLKLNGIKI